MDAKALIAERTEDGVPGSEWLLDHVHPSIHGHQLIADLLYETMEGMKLVSKPEGWETTRDKLWQHHLSFLSEAYLNGSKGSTSGAAGVPSIRLLLLPDPLRIEPVQSNKQ